MSDRMTRNSFLKIGREGVDWAQLAQDSIHRTVFTGQYSQDCCEVGSDFEISSDQLKYH